MSTSPSSHTHTKTHSKKSKSKFFIIVVLVCVAALVYAINSRDTGYRVPTGTTATVNGGNGGSVCKKVTNNCTAGDIFVPTKSDAEWQGTDGFINKHPSCVAITECGCKTNSDCGSNTICSGYSAAIAGAGVCGGGKYVITPITSCVHAQYCCKTPSGTYYAQDPRIAASNCATASDVVVANSYCSNFTSNCSVVGTSPGTSCSPGNICFPDRGYCSNYTTYSSCVAANSACSWTQTSAPKAEVLGQCVTPASCTLPRGGTIAHGANIAAYKYASETASAGNCSSSMCKPEIRTCTNGVLSGTYTNKTCTASCDEVCYNTKQPTCFVAGTQVLLADGNYKNIENIQTGEVLRGANGVVNKVLKPTKTFYTDDFYAINGTGYFVTAGHPFMTTQGWKSFDPKMTKKEVPDLQVDQLKIGDMLVTKNGLVRLYAYTTKKDPQYVYNFGLDGDHTYYANDYLVHNKYNCPAGACGGDCTKWNITSGICGCPDNYPDGDPASGCYYTTCLQLVEACDECTLTAQCPKDTSCKVQNGSFGKVCVPSAQWYTNNQPGTSYPNGYPLCAAQ